MNAVPNKPKTPIRGVRVPDEEWVPAQDVARVRGESMTDVVRRALREYADVETFDKIRRRINDEIATADAAGNLQRLMVEYERIGIRETRPELWASLSESLEALGLSVDTAPSEKEHHG